ncbi:unnamed protein product [Sympodiomycopsis kandeliae]
MQAKQALNLQSGFYLLLSLLLVIAVGAKANHVQDRRRVPQHFGAVSAHSINRLNHRASSDDQNNSLALWSWSTAASLVSQMTLEEKVNLTTGIHGSLCVGQTGSVSRLNVTSICLADGPTGVRNRRNVSQFPAQITTAATFDLDLVEARSNALGQEYHDVGANFMFGPVASGPSGRTLLGGRYWEGNGGDEYLSGAITYTTIKSAQDQGIVATLKHLLGYEQETARGARSILSEAQPYSVNVDPSTIHHTYLWPFAEGVRAGAGSVMCSYNRVNGQHACSSDNLLNVLLKGELGFQGAVVSDYGAVWSLDDSVKNGMDINMPGDGSEIIGIPTIPDEFGPLGENLRKAVEQGRIPESRVDEMVSRLLAPVMYYQNSTRDHPRLTLDAGNGILQVKKEGGDYPNVQRDHYKVIRQIGTESLTMVKNRVHGGAKGLPLDVKKLQKVAVIGSDAGPHKDEGRICTALGSCAGAPRRTVTIGEGSGYAIPPYISDPLGAITRYLSEQNSAIQVRSALGRLSHWDAIRYARDSDVALVFVGQVREESSDESSFFLDSFDQEQILKVASVNSNTIVILHVPAPVSIESFVNHPNVTSILWAYYPGQESGNSLTPILFGDTNPSGRLPFTIPKKLEDYIPNNLFTPSSFDKDPQLNFTEGDNIDWKWFDNKDIQPRYWFGYGMSYTTFEYSHLSVKEDYQKDDTSLQPTNEKFIDEARPETRPSSIYDILYTVSVKVTNTGSRGGKEVIQLYVSLPSSTSKHLLRGFKKIHLNQGESKVVHFDITRKDLSRWDEQRSAWIRSKGTYTFFASLKGAGAWEQKDGTVSQQLAV